MENKNDIIMPVSEWNRSKLAQGKYILVYTLGNGSMIDEKRKRGYVVQQYHREGGERSRFFLSHKKALECFVAGWN